MADLKIYCPECRRALDMTPDLESCLYCRTGLRDSSGVLDFVRSPDRQAERDFYDNVYSGASLLRNGQKASVNEVTVYWELPERPESRLVISHLGDVSGKKILLLGNGNSVKELAFLLDRPDMLVYSDLSMHALANIKKTFDLDPFTDHLRFAAIDAHNLPFLEESFDVVYGYAMVHHLPDLDRFFASVMRVLKPKGKAVFLDDAYAPLWHWSKQTWLKPLMKYSHKKTGISPEDYRFTIEGGFKESALADRIICAGGEPWFERTSFLTYLIYRATEKVLPIGMDRFLKKPLIARSVSKLDALLCKLPGFKVNQIRLVWGLRKPA